MSLIKSISGIRGTIGGIGDDNLNPINVMRFVAAYVSLIKAENPKIKTKIILGRDGRISGEMVKDIVVGTILSLGVDVIDLGQASTPTVEFIVAKKKAQGGIILTASHNPAGWNALKFLDGNGEFLSSDKGTQVLTIAEKEAWEFVNEDTLGNYYYNSFLIEDHLDACLKAPLVDREKIAAADFKVVVDGINSVGGIIIPKILKSLGLKEENIIELNCDSNGHFAHKPEPLDENLSAIKELVKKEKADLGIVVDPDVDRLAFIDEKGNMFGEEYTLVAVADYVLSNFETLEALRPSVYKKAAVSNLSSSRALKDQCGAYGASYEASAVGEVNVVEAMKKVKAVIGGEGNGGVIFPELHYGRDAVIGLTLFLSALAKSDKKMSEYRKLFSDYKMIKDRINLSPEINVLEILQKVKEVYSARISEDKSDVLAINDIDGIKIDFNDAWLHLRASNTEPIIRIYAEAKNLTEAQEKVEEVKKIIL